MSSRDPKDDPPKTPQDLFPFDEMSTGETSSMLRRANVVTGAPDQPVPQKQPELKPMTGAQLAFRPSAPPRPGAKPTTGTQPAFKPTAGAPAAFRPSAPPPTGKTGTAQFAAFKPSAPEPAKEEEAPVFDAERLQAQIRAMSVTDSALGRAAQGKPKPAKLPTTAVEDTFVKAKMKQAESKVVDFDLDEDLG